MLNISTAEDAVNVAELFLRRYYPFNKLNKVIREKDTWITEFDVSVMGPVQNVRIVLESETGKVIEYTKL
jgi:hypothetical protein